MVATSLKNEEALLSSSANHIRKVLTEARFYKNFNLPHIIAYNKIISFCTCTKLNENIKKR